MRKDPHDVSHVLTKKNYLHPESSFDPNFRQPWWMELMGVAIFACAGLGEGKSVNAVLHGLPKALTFCLIGLAMLHLFLRGDLDRGKKMLGPCGMFIAYVTVLAGWSCFIWFHNFTTFASITRGAEKIVYQTIALLVAIAAAYLYEQRSIDIFAIGIMIANTAIMFSEIPLYGFGPSMTSLFTSIFSLGNNTYGYAERLEIHEVTFLYAFFVVYYLFFAPRHTARQRTRNRVLIALSVWFLLVGIKRILIPAIFVSIVYVWFVRRRRSPSFWVILTGVFWVVLFWTYLTMVHYGTISQLMHMFGINPMGRDYIWGLTKAYYRFSPTYIGLGFEAVDAIVTHFYEVGLIDVAYPLHNDILKVFVELGFPGLVFWSVYLYIILPVYWSKAFGHEAALLYMALMNPISITYLTDNTAFYFWVTLCLRLIPLAHCCFPHEVLPAAKPAWKAPPPEKMQRLIRERYQQGG